MPQPWITGVITGVLDETKNTRRFFISVPGIEQFDFEPGQFVTIDLPIHEQKNKRWRSYSIASCPNGTNQFELVVVWLEGGAGSTWLFEHGLAGTEILFRGPQGKFTLPEEIEKDMYLVCTGTGIAPFRSMVHQIKNHQLPHKNIYLIFGCRKFSDVLYYQELKSLEKELDHFYYMPTFSREPANNEMQLPTGYVHAIYEQLIHQQMSKNDKGETQPAPASFYLCGWRNMVNEAKEKLQAHGYDRKDIHLELYD